MHKGLWARAVVIGVALLAAGNCKGGSDGGDEPPPHVELPLPEFSACEESRPVLPAKWQAVALMQDMFTPRLVFGRFTYDESVGGFRFELADRYGTKLDLFVTSERKLYELSGGEVPRACQLLSDASPYTVPARTWLGEGAVCVGKAPILNRQQQWWKTPDGVDANWLWYDDQSTLPFRSMYYQDVPISEPVPIYEHFTFNYFPSFEAVEDTALAEIQTLCQGADRASPDWADVELNHVVSLFGSDTLGPADEAAVTKIQSWIPGLSECASVDDIPPAWPHQLQLTAYMTAVSFEPDPFPTRVYYDWDKTQQNSSLFTFPTDPAQFVRTAVLTGNTGYSYIADEDGQVASCDQSLPGPPVPNWKNVDGCECRAQIAPGTVLNPSQTPTKILWCPTDLSAQQVFWTWYSNAGEAVVFMQTHSSPTAGTGLNLADYTGWLPGSVAPPGTFALPSKCGPPKTDVPSACHNCHLPVQ